MNSESGGKAALGWRFECVLPNLTLPEFHPDEAETGAGGHWARGITLDTADIALVPPSEPRVVHIIATSAAAKALCEGFRGVQGERITPAVLILREGSAEHLHRSWEPLVAFRNAVALSFILKARAGRMQLQPFWSDTFDFHPAVPDRQGRLFIGTPALRSMGIDPARFQGMPSPYVDQYGRRLFADRNLYELFAREWQRCYGANPTDDSQGQALWRSLEHAYYALSAGVKHQQSLHDFGLHLAIWISAVEILVRAECRASLRTALNLLGEFHWYDAELRAQRYRRRVSNQDRDLNAVQLLYWHLYQARNDFLHGNPVSVETFFSHRLGSPSAADAEGLPPPDRDDEAGRSLHTLAAVVYRTALAAFLRRRYPLDPGDSIEVNTDAAENLEYANAVRRGIGLR